MKDRYQGLMLNAPSSYFDSFTMQANYIYFTGLMTCSGLIVKAGRAKENEIPINNPLFAIHLPSGNLNKQKDKDHLKAFLIKLSDNNQHLVSVFYLYPDISQALDDTGYYDSLQDIQALVQSSGLVDIDQSYLFSLNAPEFFKILPNGESYNACSKKILEKVLAGDAKITLSSDWFLNDVKPKVQSPSVFFYKEKLTDQKNKLIKHFKDQLAPSV